MDWFRSWHNAPTDPKWLLIARKANVPPGMVSSVAWALMDYASQNEQRGSVDGFDPETYASWAGWDEADVIAVIAAMRNKGIIADDGRLAAWDKRQPKREDPGAADRMRKMRDAQRNADVTRDTSVTSGDVTGGYAVLHDVTTDKIREDKNREDTRIPEAAEPSASADKRGDPGTLAEWHDLLREATNKTAVLLSMFSKLYPDAVDVPDYARIGKTAKQVGGAGRLAELMWIGSTKPPSGDVMAYLVRVSKNGAGRNGNDPKRMTETQTDYEELKRRYVPKDLEDIIVH